MSSWFNVGSRTSFPLVVTDFETGRNVNTVFNPVVGGGVVAAAYPASPRVGTMTAMFSSFADALDFDNMLSGVSPITFNSDVPMTMTFLADQSIRVVQGDDEILLPDGTDGYLWAVSFGYQEVTV